MAVLASLCGGCIFIWRGEDVALGILDEQGNGIMDEIGIIIEAENGISMKQSEYDTLVGALPTGSLLLAAIPDAGSETGYVTRNITPTQWLDYVLGRYTLDITITEDGTPIIDLTGIENIADYEVVNVAWGGQDYNKPFYERTDANTLTMTNGLLFNNGDIVTIKLSKVT